MVQKGALSTLRGPSISTHSLVSHGEDEESELTGPRGEEERGRGRGGGVGGVRRRCGGLMQKKQRVATCTRWIISSGSHECSGHACTHAHTKKENTLPSPVLKKIRVCYRTNWLLQVEKFGCEKPERKSGVTRAAQQLYLFAYYYCVLFRSTIVFSLSYDHNLVMLLFDEEHPSIHFLYDILEEANATTYRAAL